MRLSSQKEEWNPLYFGVSGSLKDAIGYYTASKETVEPGPDHIKVSVEFTHLITKEKETVSWVLQN